MFNSLNLTFLIYSFLFGYWQDETGVYKNLLQETAHRAGLNLPVYTTIRSGPGHGPNFSCSVEIAGMHFTGDPSRTKKQAQKNAAMAAWSALRKCEHFASVVIYSLYAHFFGVCLNLSSLQHTFLFLLF